MSNANEVVLDNLKRQKNVVKMQLIKRYSRLMALMFEEEILVN